MTAAKIITLFETYHVSPIFIWSFIIFFIPLHPVHEIRSIKKEMRITYYKLNLRHLILLAAAITGCIIVGIAMSGTTRGNMGYLFGVLGVVFIGLNMCYTHKSRKKLALTNAMLETNYNILEMSHEEMMEANRQLIAANERAQESSKMKSNFIKQISHEIRTPLNILSGFTQVITTPGLQLSEEERNKINQDIVENTNRITGLINKMLELSDASSKTVIERSDETSAAEIANQAIHTISLADGEQIDFNLTIDDQAKAASLRTNLSSAAHALSLILDNARKFTSQKADKQIRLIVKAAASIIEFIVEDNGIGVPVQEAEHIFDEFVQLDEYYEGTGIGLTIARSIANRLGGNVVLDTSYTNGARFVMTLPK